MKQIDKMSRLTGELEKSFRLLNEQFFGNELPTPVITVIPSARSYAHYTTWDAWQTKDGGKREINIASGTLNRPLENILASLLHEMVHMYNDIVLNVQDTSNKGVYHNKNFKEQAEAHGLIVSRSDRYGWCITTPGDDLLNFVLNHDELREVEMCRTDPAVASVGVGAHTGSVGAIPTTTSRSHHRKYACPCCGNSVRATKAVHILCMDCNAPMIEV